MQPDPPKPKEKKNFLRLLVDPSWPSGFIGASSDNDDMYVVTDLLTWTSPSEPHLVLPPIPAWRLLFLVCRNVPTAARSRGRCPSAPSHGRSSNTWRRGRGPGNSVRVQVARSLRVGLGPRRRQQQQQQQQAAAAAAASERDTPLASRKCLARFGRRQIYRGSTGSGRSTAGKQASRRACASDSPAGGCARHHPWLRPGRRRRRRRWWWWRWRGGSGGATAAAYPPHTLLFASSGPESASHLSRGNCPPALQMARRRVT
ncbi:hypothetical protein BDY21DRAFT_177583 [Lineolata rhizophorae]|uniref:Uncharacterized protein n=1 Tax=Lineolata rhizophorae TaxID=578093 RepID=A0A6A6P7C3_9PEZI|nr:hypothetical protein BDY21DRAFT_177583 [Lineolata rhizophorae]